MIVELHILQNFAPSCLNRDDTNSPKECQFGGYRRARISSQCLKRAIRGNFRSGGLISVQDMAVRTKELHSRLVGLLKKAGKPEDAASKAAKSAIEEIGLGLKGTKTEYLLFVGEQEVQAIKAFILEHWDDLVSGDKRKIESISKELRGLLDGGKAADLALFGRMLADIPDKNIDAACQVAHAISTHKVGIETDFYTAVDDLQPTGETGAGMMGDIEFNSACFYRYANIDLDQLKTNLRDDALARKTIEAFIRASVEAIPTGKQNWSAAQNPPDFVMAVVRDSGTWSLANAFSRPVSDRGDLMADSVSALVRYWVKLNAAYPPKDGNIKAKPAFCLTDNELPDLDRKKNLDELVKVVNEAVVKDC